MIPPNEPTRNAALIDVVLHRKLLGGSRGARELQQLPEALEDMNELHALPAVMARTQSIRVRSLSCGISA